MKDAWDLSNDIPMRAQCLRDNAARFRKDKSILNPIEVRETSLANQAVWSINSPLSLLFFSIIFNILVSLPAWGHLVMYFDGCCCC